MFFLRRLAIYLFAVLNGLAFYFLFIREDLLWVIFLILNLFLLLIIKYITHSKADKKELFFFWLTPFLLINSAGLFLLVVDDIYLKYLVIFGVAFWHILYLHLINTFLRRPTDYRPFSLNYFYEYTSVIIYYFATVSFFALNIFLNWHFIWLSLVCSVLAVIFFLQNFKVNKWIIKNKKYIFVLFFVLFFELSLVLSWLPVSYYLKGFWLTCFYYLTLFLINRKNKNLWRLNEIAIRLIIVSVLIILSLLTTRWF